MSPMSQFVEVRPMARSDSAVSPEAKSLDLAASEVQSFAERSIAQFGPKLAAITKIWELVNECNTVGWDGADADPLFHLAGAFAEDFVRALPSNVPMPEFAPEPDGSISLDWIQSRHRIFSLSIGTSRRLAYAWLDGTDRGHGVAHFDRGIVPLRVLEGIRMIVNQGS